MTKTLTAYFTSSGIPQIGLTPLVNIYQLNPSSNILVVTNGAATEIGGGWYRYDFTTYDSTQNYVFTFDGGAALSDFDRYKFGGNESYDTDTAKAVWDEPIGGHTVTGSTGETVAFIKADTATILINDTTMTALLDLILKYERNRTKIDTLNSQLLIYDNDNTTIIQAFNLKDINGNPSVADVLERVPTM